MTTERLEMHVLREILRQKLALGRSHREVVASVGVSIWKVAAVLARAHSLGLDAAGAEAMSGGELAANLYPKATEASDPTLSHPLGAQRRCVARSHRESCIAD